MANHAGAPRRARTAAGTTPPDIALTLARVIAASRELLRTLACCDDVTSRSICAHLSDTMRSSSSTDHQQLTLHALGDLARTHGCVNAESFYADIDATLEAAWTATTNSDTIAEVIDHGVAAGFDAELVCWDVIGVESLNHIGLIHKEASKMLRKLPERSTAELVGYGWTGLRVALRMYNPALGFSFSTYACPRINGAIRDGVRGENPLPKRLTTVVRAAAAMEEHLTQELQRTPSYAEIAAHLDSVESADLLPRLAPAASIEELSVSWDNDKSRDPAFLIDDSDPADEAHRLLRVAAVRDAITSLPEDEAAAITLLCLEERTLADAAGILGVETRVLRAAKRRGMTTLASRLAPLSTAS